MADPIVLCTSGRQKLSVACFPEMEALGITNAGAADCGALAQRLREEAVAKRGL